MKLPFFCFVVLLSTNSTSWLYPSIYAHEETRKEGGPRTGGHLAVQAYDPDQGFKLNPPALQTLGVKFSPLQEGSTWKVPSRALVRIKHATGVYRRIKEGWITLVLVKILNQDKDSMMIRSEDLQSGDEIAVSGVAFLRMTEADLSADTVDNCAH